MWFDNLLIRTDECPKGSLVIQLPTTFLKEVTNYQVLKYNNINSNITFGCIESELHSQSEEFDNSVDSTTSESCSAATGSTNIESVSSGAASNETPIDECKKLSVKPFNII